MNFELYNDDCIKKLKELPENSVDSVVTDPPYHLTSIVNRFGSNTASPAQIGATGAYSRHSKGFMGQTWDGGDIAFRPETWIEVMRVLKPGGHMLSFSGTRTYHRMVCAIEDAGFDVRDMISWVYGCLSEDTQIVTKDGIKSYTEIKVNDIVLCYNNGKYEYHPIEEIYEYKIKDTAFRIQSDFTDQIVSRNHRCIVERDGKEVFVNAETLKQQESIPFLEDVFMLQNSISNGVPQIIRKWKGHKTTLATITSFTYEGIVWCVKVPTGSFVAIRNGKAFATGNSGFPKSHNVSKALDNVTGKQAKGFNFKGGDLPSNGGSKFRSDHPEYKVYAPSTDAAKQWDGWGTALKPAHEPVVLARKPFSEKTVAKNVMKHGTGAINIDECRIKIDSKKENDKRIETDYVLGEKKGMTSKGMWHNANSENLQLYKEGGRWPANFIHDGSDEVLALFPETTSGSFNGIRKGHPSVALGKMAGGTFAEYDSNSGSAARFFYCPKSSKKDRDENLSAGTNVHPTVKPTDLMRYLCRLVTPKNGIVLDPFMGSGSTGKAAMLEDFRFIGIEQSKEYFDIAEARISKAKEEDKLEQFYEQE